MALEKKVIAEKSEAMEVASEKPTVKVDNHKKIIRAAFRVK